jgi:enoyl-CoA hydratase/carnithine racemase
VSDSHVRLEIVDRAPGLVATVTIDRPGHLNALNTPVLVALAEAIEGLATNDKLRAFVLTGAGSKAFISGADIHEMAALEDPSAARTFITRIHRCCEALRSLPVPTIARINGHAFGGALEIAAACDVRVAVDTAVFGMPEVRLGIPSVIEAALFPQLVGWGRTRELLLFGENFSASEALDWGFIERLAPADGLDAVVEHWLQQLAACKPKAVTAQKRLIRTWEDVPMRAAIQAGIDAFEDAARTGEPAEAMAAFLKRRRSPP